MLTWQRVFLLRCYGLRCERFGVNIRAFSSALRNRKGKSVVNPVQHFVDCKRVKVIGGNGGNGQNTFLQLWCNEKAGPDGGDGGNGGHVLFKASEGCRCLSNVHSIIQGQHGVNGGTTDCTGKSGEHLFIDVPVGTVVKLVNGKTIADLDDHGDIFVAARGGAGGRGNHYFMTNHNKAPLVAEYGAKGEEKSYLLEMKSIAHAGLIGFPNAGKSTLLRAISRARPKVAAYPFTTLAPHLGVIQYDDYEQISVADIPGLIEGAHENRGLGVSFLRHIERCTCLLYVIDLSVEEPWLQLDALKHELEMYQTGLSSRPHAVLCNKLDLPGSPDKLVQLQNRIEIPAIGISAKRGDNLQVFLKHLRQLYDAKHLPTNRT